MSAHTKFPPGPALRAATVLVVSLAAFVLAAAAQTPHIGYVYPAGGCTNTTFELTIGGQFLARATNIYVTGPGVEGAVLECNRPLGQTQFNELRDQYRQLESKRRAAAQTGNRANSEPTTNIWTAADQAAFQEIRAQILQESSQSRWQSRDRRNGRRTNHD